MTSRPLALITGGAKRVGRATAHALAASGCDLILTYRTSDTEAQSAATEFETLGASVRLEQLDLDDLAAVEDLSRRLADTLPSLDIIVHNASVYEPSPLASLTADHALHHYRVNALAPLLLSAMLAPLLKQSARRGGSAIVAMADIHAIGRPRRNHAAYSMSKAALAEMVRSLARDLAPDVRVNGVAPGVVEWPDHGPESDPEAQQRYLSRVPLERAGAPEDAAEVVRWLALDAHYTTGQIIRVDGGRWLA